MVPFFSPRTYFNTITNNDKAKHSTLNEIKASGNHGGTPCIRVNDIIL